jgi:hypothetical protein
MCTSYYNNCKLHEIRTKHITLADGPKIAVYKRILDISSNRGIIQPIPIQQEIVTIKKELQYLYTKVPVWNQNMYDTNPQMAIRVCDQLRRIVITQLHNRIYDIYCKLQWILLKCRGLSYYVDIYRIDEGEYIDTINFILKSDTILEQLKILDNIKQNIQNAELATIDSRINSVEEFAKNITDEYILFKNKCDECYNWDIYAYIYVNKPVHIYENSIPDILNIEEIKKCLNINCVLSTNNDGKMEDYIEKLEYPGKNAIVYIPIQLLIGECIRVHYKKLYVEDNEEIKKKLIKMYSDMKHVVNTLFYNVPDTSGIDPVSVINELFGISSQNK